MNATAALPIFEEIFEEKRPWQTILELSYFWNSGKRRGIKSDNASLENVLAPKDPGGIDESIDLSRDR